MSKGESLKTKINKKFLDGALDRQRESVIDMKNYEKIYDELRRSASETVDAVYDSGSYLNVKDAFDDVWDYTVDCICDSMDAPAVMSDDGRKKVLLSFFEQYAEADLDAAYWLDYYKTWVQVYVDELFEADMKALYD